MERGDREIRPEGELKAKGSRPRSRRPLNDRFALARFAAQSLWGAGRPASRLSRLATFISISGKSGIDRRAERRRANPSNLIRVVPAEGAEMRALASELPHIASDILA